MRRYVAAGLLCFSCAATALAGESRIELATITSQTLGISKSFNVYLPADYDENTDEHYPVVYLFRGHEREWVNPSEDASRSDRMIKDVADELFASGAIGKMILVMPGLSSTDNVVPAWSVNFLEPERLGNKPGIGSGQFEDYLIGELLPFVDANYRTIASRLQRGLDGFSFGGTTSMMVATRHPELFCTVGSYDGTLPFLNNATTGSGPGSDLFAADFADPHFGVPRNVAYMRSYIAANQIRDLDNDRLSGILSMQFLIRTLAAGGNRVRAQHHITLLAAQNIENGFADITLAPNAEHNWFWADRHVAETLPRHWQRFQNPVQIIPVQLLLPADGDVLNGETEVQWSIDSDATDLRGELFLNDGGDSWTPVDSGLGDGSFSWNTLDLSDGTRYRMRVVVSGDSIFGAHQNDATFTINNPGNAQPDAALLAPIGDEFVSGDFAVRWQAADADGDELSIGLDLLVAGQVFPLAEDLANTGEYIWNSTTAPNSDLVVLRLGCSDGSLEVQDLSGELAVYNERMQLPPSQVEQVAGTSDAVIMPQFVDAGQLTGNLYHITFEDSSETKSYNVRNVDTGVTLVENATALDGTTEGPAFDGIRLIIKDFDPPEVDRDNSGWTAGNSTLGFSISTQTVFVGGQQRTGLPWPADYEIEIFDHVVDTSTSELGLPPKPISFTTKNLTADRQVEVIFSELLSPDSLISDQDKITIIERDTADTPQLAWSVVFSGDQGYTRPAAGDRFLVRILKPLTHDDVFELRAAITSVDERPAQLPQEVSLYPNYPNPFNPETTIQYFLARPGRVVLAIYNVLGQEVVVLVDEVQEAGQHAVTWHARTGEGLPVTSGIYFYKVVTGRQSLTRKMLLLK